MSRYRITDNTTSVSAGISFTYADGGTRKSPTSETVSQPDTREMWDVVTPNYKKLQNEGAIINSPMTKKVVRETISSDSWYNYLGLAINKTTTPWTYSPQTGFIDSGTMLVTSMGVSLPAFVSVDTESLIAIASNEAWAGVDASKASTLVTIAEASKTASSIAQVLQRAINISRAIRKADIAHLKGEISFNELSRRYLEARYALRPLAYDCKSIVEAWNEVRDDKPRFVSRGFASGSDGTSASVVNTTRFASVDVHASTSSQTDVNVRAGVLYSITANKPSQLQTWGLVDAPLAVWELVPFSFIIDWFINVGTTIAAWQIKPFVQVLTSWVTVKQTTARSVVVTGISVKPNVYPDQDLRGREARGSGTHLEFIETTSRTPGAPRSVIPQVDINLDFLKLLDLVLILRKIMK